jgi:apolipoprotein N-acyltransferase
LVRQPGGDGALLGAGRPVGSLPGAALDGDDGPGGGTSPIAPDPHCLGGIDLVWPRLDLEPEPPLLATTAPDPKPWQFGDSAPGSALGAESDHDRDRRGQWLLSLGLAEPPGWANELAIGIAGRPSLHLVGAGLRLRPLADRPDQALTLGIIQGNIPTREKLTPEGIALGRDRYSQAYRQLTAPNQNQPPVDGVVLPEGALPYIWTDQARAESSLFKAIAEVRVPALVGAFGPGVAAPNQPRTYTQSLFVLNGQGEEVSRYNKVKLVLLGEYIPGWLANGLGRLSPISATMEFGADRQRVTSPWGPIAIGICYEPAFSAVLRDQVAAGARFGVTSSNLDPYSLVLMAQHQAQDSLRAIETDRWIVRASNSGYSGTIDPHGQVQAQSEPQQFVSLRQRLYRRDSQTPYVRWGDRLTPFLALVLFALQIRSPKQPDRP